jgi:polyphosphate kinase
VAVLVELKARFDEERNIEWAQKLEKAGVHVAYGIAGLKIHTKVTMVVREEDDGLRTYCHIGTGNYHPDTAQLYEDMGLFTCADDIGADVADLFNYLTGFAPSQEYAKLLVAPLFLRDRITVLIEQERMEAEAGRPARIFLKMNNLEDPRIIDALYRASQAGVEIDAVVRSVTRLKAGVPGLSERIRVHSVVGRFLEHSRVYRFHHGGEDLIYIGSADMMHRNLDARVEALTPIEHPALKRYIDHVVGLYLADTKCRWELLADGSHRKVHVDPADIGIHDRLMHHALRGTRPLPMG